MKRDRYKQQKRKHTQNTQQSKWYLIKSTINGNNDRKNADRTWSHNYLSTIDVNWKLGVLVKYYPAVFSIIMSVQIYACIRQNENNNNTWTEASLSIHEIKINHRLLSHSVFVTKALSKKKLYLTVSKIIDRSMEGARERERAKEKEKKEKKKENVGKCRQIFY